MVLGVEIFKNDDPGGGSIVPIAFPLIAGAGSNIAVALLVNMAIVYLVLKSTRWVEKLLGPTGVAILRKAFGIILLAIAVKLFITNTGIELN